MANCRKFFVLALAVLGCNLRTAISLLRERLDGNIQNGDADFTNHFQYQLSIETTEGEHLSSGAIFAPAWAVTAAQGIVDFTPRVLQVRLTSTNLNENEGILLNVTNVVIHENFDKDSLQNDIALIQFKEPTESYETLSILPAGTNLATNEVVTQGYDAMDGELQRVSFQPDLEQCSLSFQQVPAESTVCLTPSTPDSCMGDVGSVGIAGENLATLGSFGQLCDGTTNGLLVATDISFYAEWITKKVLENTQTETIPI